MRLSARLIFFINLDPILSMQSKFLFLFVNFPLDACVPLRFTGRVSEVLVTNHGYEGTR